MGLYGLEPSLKGVGKNKMAVFQCLTMWIGGDGAEATI